MERIFGSWKNSNLIQQQKINIVAIFIPFFLFLLSMSLTACNTFNFSTRPTLTKTSISSTYTPIPPSLTVTLTTTPSITPTHSPTSSPMPTQTATPFAGHPELFFSEYKTENKGEIFSLNLITGEKTLIFDPKEHGLSEIQRIYEISASPLSTYLVFSLRYINNNEEVILLNRKIGEIKKIYTSSTSEKIRPNFFWRDDEMKLFFNTYIKGNPYGETSQFYESFLFEFSPLVDTLAQESLINESQIFEIRERIFTECEGQSISCEYQMIDFNNEDKLIFDKKLSPDKKRFAFIYSVGNIETISSLPRYITLIDVDSKENSQIFSFMGYYPYSSEWSTDGQNFFYIYIPHTSNTSSLNMYSIDSRKTVELMQNVEAFGVQPVGYPAEISLTPLPTRGPTYTPRPSPTLDLNLPSCRVGESFVDGERENLNGFLDFVGGACKTSNNAINILINLREIPEYLDLSETGIFEYQILIKPPLNMDGNDYLIKISPIDIQAKGSMDKLFKCTYGEFNNRIFIYIDDCNFDINTMENSISVTIDNFKILPDARLGFFTSSSFLDDSMSWYDMARP